MQRFLIFTSIFALVCGCASTSSKPKAKLASSQTKDANNSTQVCEKEYLTGTHIPETVCRNRADQDRERDMTQDALRRASQQGDQNPAASGGGGR
jgi:hypothetical protein